jgi:putative membrane protein
MENQASKLKYKNWIILLSVAIPIVVVLLFSVNLKKMGFAVEPLTFLPPIYASINALTAVFLVSAVIAIKKGNRALHENLMKSAIACSVAFLAMYVAYHMTSDSTKFGGEGIIIPLVLITYVRALSQLFDQHKKIAKITFPIWLYVAVTGVVVYLMISPYYV